MRMHVMMHVEYEGPALIAEWAVEHGHTVTRSLAPDTPPPLDEIDFLVVMGGTMSAADEAGFPWLADEKRYVADAIAARKLVLGICLGSQILAEAIGGKVRRNEYSEIGWYPVRKTEAAENDALFAVFPDILLAGHWHGDTFDLPSGTAPVLSSDATANQAFTCAEGRAVGLQFHIEWDDAALNELIDACIDELVDGGPYLATAPEMLAGLRRNGESCRAALWMLLDLITHVDDARPSIPSRGVS